MFRRITATIIAAVALFATAGVAYADNCYNASRPGIGLSTNPADFSEPLFKGRWLWLPSVGVPLPAWGYVAPEGRIDGNGGAWLLANTPYCEAGGILFYNGPRTTEHGIQSGCGFFS